MGWREDEEDGPVLAREGSSGFCFLSGGLVSPSGLGGFRALRVGSGDDRSGGCRESVS